MEGEQRRESAVDLALHVGEVRGRQQAIEDKQRELDQWRSGADERLKQQDERLRNLPAEVARAIDEIPADETPPVSQPPTSDASHTNKSTANGSIADPNAPTSSDGKDAGRRVAPPPAVPNPNDPALQSTPQDQQINSDGTQQSDNPPPPAPRRSVTHRFR